MKSSTFRYVFYQGGYTLLKILCNMEDLIDISGTMVLSF